MEIELSPPRGAISTGVSARRIWPVTGILAGLTGFGATLLTDIHVETDRRDELTSMANMVEINQRSAHLSIVLGFITVALLLAFSAYWRGVVEPKTPRSLASRMVTQSITAAAGALMLGYGWKGASAIYHADGMDHGTYDDMGLYIYYILNDFGSYIGWFGVTVVAGAFVWMSLRERTIPVWIGIFSCLPVLAVLGFTGLTGLPGFPGVVSPIWMVIACAGLLFHGTFTESSATEK